jgi:hypothetical protein
MPRCYIFWACAGKDSRDRGFPAGAAHTMVTLRSYRTDDQDAVVTLWWNSWRSIRPGLRHPQPFATWRARWASDIAMTQDVVVAVSVSQSALTARGQPAQDGGGQRTRHGGTA